jgi:hypothetical protein
MYTYLPPMLLSALSNHTHAIHQLYTFAASAAGLALTRALCTRGRALARAFALAVAVAMGVVAFGAILRSLTSDVQNMLWPETLSWT